jgi:Uma2 family endonuclease
MTIHRHHATRPPRRIAAVPTTTTTYSPVTAADLTSPGNEYPKHSELWDGTLYAYEPSGGSADYVALQVGAALLQFVRARALGWVWASNQGFFVARDPDRVLSPDTAFLSFASLPELPLHGFVERAPEFAVEVRSPEDSARALHAKAGVWIGHRVPVVWAVDPMERSITVYCAGAAPNVVREPGVVDAAPVLPGFSMRVAEVFAGVPRYGRSPD